MIKIGKKFDKLKLYYYGYFYFWVKYFSPKKLFNLLFNTYEFKTKKLILKSFPSVVHIDVSNGCILHCPLCATGKGDKSQTKAIMNFENFKKIFDKKIKDYVFFVWLYNWGEPFLCKDIFEIVGYCHKNNVGVKIDSNLNYYNDDILKNIVKSKIDYLSLSIDGFTQKKYQFYRKGGNVQKVFEGIKKINGYKKKLKSKYPKIVWQFLMNNQNFKEVEEAQCFAKNIGVDIFEARPLFLFTDVDFKYNRRDYLKYLSRLSVPEEEAKRVKGSGACRFLWQSFVVNPDNSFSPCPVIYKDADVFGSIYKEDHKTVREIINSGKYLESRKLFIFKNYKEKIFTPCRRCNWFSKD